MACRDEGTADNQGKRKLENAKTGAPLRWASTPIMLNFLLREFVNKAWLLMTMFGHMRWYAWHNRAEMEHVLFAAINVNYQLDDFRYPYGMKPGAEYFECLGRPKGEDFNCSDSLTFDLSEYDIYISDHRHYFDHKVGGIFSCCWANESIQ